MSTPGYFNMRHLVQHENYLNIKELIKNTAMTTEIEKNDLIKIKRKPIVGTARAGKMGLDTEALIGKLDDSLSGERTLAFESRFECGNLFLSQKVSDNEYNLLMQNDINTQGHT